MAPVSATRSAAVIPRRKMAIASAPTWASLTDPSAIPATSADTSSADSSSPSRLRRMSSAVSIAVPDPRDEAQQQSGEIARRPLGIAQRLLVAERHVGQALGQVGDRRYGRDTQAAVPGHR